MGLNGMLIVPRVHCAAYSLYVPRADGAANGLLDRVVGSTER